MPRGAFPRPPLEERLWAKVDRSDEAGCWLWTAARSTGGYGLFWADGRLQHAHRVAYELEVGPIPEGYELDHVAERGCVHRHCVNPAHLEPVTHKENIRRSDHNGGRHWAEKTHCPKGHPYDEGNTFVNARGSRECRTCRNAKRREARERAKGAPLRKYERKS